PQRREAGRFAGASADKVRADHQPPDGEGAWPRTAAIAARIGLRLPRSIIAEHSVEGSDHFSHDGDDNDLGFLVGVGKTVGEGLESGIVSACAEGCHVEDITDRHPTAVDTSVSPELATVEVVWCETD